MIFIGIALLIAVGIALVITVDAGSLVGLTQEQTGQIIPLLLILILVAGGAFSRKIKLSQMITNILLWAGLFAIVLIGYSYKEEIKTIANKVMGEVAPTRATISKDGHVVTFKRSNNGSFLIDTKVNDANISMIFDTGASSVVLNNLDAKAAGIDVDKLKYNVKVLTANGVSFTSATTLNHIKIGNIERYNIKTFVAKKDALDTSLLGMTFLETLVGYSVKGDSLEFQN